MKKGTKIKLNELLVKKTIEEGRENKVGRYSCSKIWSMTNKNREGEYYLPPEDYIKGEDIDFAGAFRMWQGTSKHKQLEELMGFKGFEVEKKKEMKVKDFEIVGIADILELGGNDVADFKTSANIKEAKRWDIFQVKLYCTLFEKDKGYVIQPRTKYIDDVPSDFWLEIIGETKRDDAWFEDVVNRLQEYHNKLVELQSKNQ